MSARPLSVLHFSTADREGGSARSAWRIHSGLRARGHRSRMLVGMREADDPDVATVWAGRAGRRANLLADRATRALGFQYQYLPSTGRVLTHPWVGEADVIQLFNTHGGYFATPMLRELSARAPLVWRLSDMWPMTGHCAYAGPCARWRTGCGSCPDLAGYPAIGLDRTAVMWRQKDELYRACRMSVVAPSSWIEEFARASPLLGRFPVHRIPNGIDAQVFHPQNRDAARQALGIEPAVKVILFSAHGLDANPRKGSEAAIEILGRIGARQDTLVLLVGEGGASWQDRLPMPVRRLGFLREDVRLAAAYAGADLLLAPSLVENLPNVVLEALACGVPVAAYDAGGMKDAVRHMHTGWLSPVADAAHLAEGLRTLLDDDALRARLGAQGRTLIEQEFSREVELDRLEALYCGLVQ